ncbi:hypothetical protein BDZ97DRAFT_1761106 [Flammula alnicola]|nr:hypothetical protein BDZ97DRAFT_1761106 [Flammula alnicola]
MSFPSDSKTTGVLPMAQTQPLYYTPGPPMYIGYPQGPTPQPPQRKSAGRRLLRALIFASFTWVLIHVLVATFRANGHWHWVHNDVALNDGDWDYDIPPGLTLEHCVQGDDWSEGDRTGFPYSSFTTFDVPLSSENIFLLSRGRLSAGSVKVITSPDQPEGSVKFVVVAKYHREEIRNLAKACLISRPKGQNGVGLFTPRWHRGGPRRREDMMHFETTVIFPEVSEGSAPLSIKSFETDVPNTVQSLEVLKIIFDAILLKGTNAPIGVQELSAVKGVIATTNGPIRGTFSTTTSLLLTTTNSPIQVFAGLESNGTHPSFVARTTNGLIEATVNLSSSSGEGGSFDVSTTTTNSPVYVTFPDAPVDSNLLLEAKTTNSPAKVFLHPTYEGSFDLQTSSVFRSELNVHHDVTDPSGKERKRDVQINTVGRGHTHGSVKWVEEDKKHESAGAVVIRTTNSPAVLDL